MLRETLFLPLKDSVVLDYFLPLEDVVIKPDTILRDEKSFLFLITMKVDPLGKLEREEMNILNIRITSLTKAETYRII